MCRPRVLSYVFCLANVKLQESQEPKSPSMMYGLFVYASKAVPIAPTVLIVQDLGLEYKAEEMLIEI